MNKKQMLYAIFSILVVCSLLVVSYIKSIQNNSNNEVEVIENVEEQEEIMDLNNYKHSTEEDVDIAITRQNEFEEQLKVLDCSCTISREEWFKQYKSLTEKYSDVSNELKIYENYSSEELDLLFRVVQAEIGSEYSFEQKCNVVSVIYNRIYDNRFGNTIKDILVKGQFSVINNGRINNVVVDENTVLACEYVFEFGDTTGGALFFDSNGKLKYEFLFNDGAHNFYKKYN